MALVIVGLGTALALSIITWLVQYRNLPKPIGVVGYSLVGGLGIASYGMSLGDDPASILFLFVLGAIMFGGGICPGSWATHQRFGW